MSLSPLAPRPPHPWVAAGQERVRFAVARGGSAAVWPDIIAWAQQAEALGFDAVWVADHPLLAPECWLTLAVLAQQTRTLRLACAVSAVPFRPPALLARLASDVDHLSGGRLILGMGVGDIPEEFAAFGIPYASTRDRLRALAEAVELVQGLWRGEPVTYHGQYYTVERGQVPPPAQQPFVPLLIGGGGEQVTLRQVARYADVTNFGPHPWTSSVITMADVRRKLAVLRRHCAAAGRPFASILRTHLVMPLVLAPTPVQVQAKVAGRPGTTGRLAGTPDEVIAYYQSLVAAGMQYFIAVIAAEDRETLELLGTRVLPAVGALPPLSQTDLEAHLDAQGVPAG